MLSLIAIALDVATDTGTQEIPGVNPWFSIVSIVLMLGVMYFLLIRPESKRKKNAAKMRSELIVGDNVTTIGGIVGRIVSIKDDTITVETGADKARLKVMKWAIQSKEEQISN